MINELLTWGIFLSVWAFPVTSILFFWFINIFLASSISPIRLSISWGILSDNCAEISFRSVREPKTCNNLKVDCVSEQSSKARPRIRIEPRVFHERIEYEHIGAIYLFFQGHQTVWYLLKYIALSIKNVSCFLTTFLHLLISIFNLLGWGSGMPICPCP